jgi:hypothetical protein
MIQPKLSAELYQVTIAAVRKVGGDQAQSHLKLA